MKKRLTLLLFTVIGCGQLMDNPGAVTSFFLGDILEARDKQLKAYSVGHIETHSQICFSVTDLSEQPSLAKINQANDCPVQKID